MLLFVDNMTHAATLYRSLARHGWREQARAAAARFRRKFQPVDIFRRAGIYASLGISERRLLQGRRLQHVALDRAWTRHTTLGGPKTAEPGLSVPTELVGILTIWLNALMGTFVVCSMGAGCVPVLALGGCAYCLWRRARPAHPYAAVPGEDLDVEEQADRAMECACGVREMETGAPWGHRSR